MKIEKFNKLKVSFRYWLLGKADENPDYYRVLEAMEVAEKYHNGKRKDGSPEFSHQITICMYLKTLHKFFKNPVEIFIIALLHDTLEDYEKESKEELLRLFPNEFIYFERISKVRNGIKIPYEQYFGEMRECEICSIVKLADRIANMSTMIGVFSYEKQTEYLEEVNTWFLPMLKYSKRLFPFQEPAYENLKMLLQVQRDTILAVRKEFE